jgi:regulator of protease activity HflC (stomatin/prohibitin superfamily)
MEAQTGIHKDSTIMLDGVEHLCQSIDMPLLTDALDAVKEQLVSECQRVQEIREEKKQHAASYHRYVSLQKELLERAVTINELAGILGPDDAYKAMQADKSDAIGETVEVHTGMGQLRENLPLWKAIRWYIGYMGEARMNDVILFLGALKIEGANRNAVDSALRTHPEIFTVRQKKREKYISLKGA